MEAAIKYGEEHKTDKSVIMTIAGAMNTRIDYSVFEKGIEQGDAQRLITSVNNIVEKLSLSLEEGCALTGITVKEYNDAVELLKEEKKTLE